MVTHQTNNNPFVLVATFCQAITITIIAIINEVHTTTQPPHCHLVWNMCQIDQKVNNYYRTNCQGIHQKRIKCFSFSLFFFLFFFCFCILLDYYYYFVVLL